MLKDHSLPSAVFRVGRYQVNYRTTTIALSLLVVLLVVTRPRAAAGAGELAAYGKHDPLLPAHHDPVHALDHVPVKHGDTSFAERRQLHTGLADNGAELPVTAPTQRRFRINEASERDYITLFDFTGRNSGDYAGVHWQKISHAQPRAMRISGTLSAEDCQALIAIGEKQLERSEVVHAPGQSGVNSVRTSFGMFITNPNEVNHPVNQKLHRIAAELAGINPVNVEATQLLRYLPGQFYRAHPDYFGTGSPHLSRGGERFATLLTWLNDVPSGGQTRFPNAVPLELSVSPKRGDSVLFYSMTKDGRTDPGSFHEAVAPGEGSMKWVAVLWIRQHEFH